jgi:hypothetical protein
MRVFTNKWFSRWADAEELSDSVLWSAAKDVVAGHVEGSLGGCLFKKRISRDGGGKLTKRKQRFNLQPKTF